MHTHTHTSLNSKQPFKPFKCRSLWRDGARRHVRFFHASGRLPAPSNKTPSRPFLRLCVLPRVGGCVLNTCVRIFDGIQMNTEAPLLEAFPPPQIWRCIRRLWFHIGFIWNRFFSFDLAVQQKGNNSRRSPRRARGCG